MSKRIKATDFEPDLIFSGLPTAGLNVVQIADLLV
jgi:hypothetical protein